MVPDWSPLGSAVCRERPLLLLELCPPDDDADDGLGVVLAEDDDDVELDYTQHVSYFALPRYVKLAFIVWRRNCCPGVKSYRG